MTGESGPETRTIPLKQGDSFQFRCHPGVSCYLNCCHKLELRLYPYDIVCLKNKLACGSAEFLERYTRLGAGVHPYFPAVMLNMVESEEAPCPFLADTGCSVYADRPSACRTYPLERGVEKEGRGAKLKSHYSVVRHSYCKGHDEEHSCTIRQWKREQRLDAYNLYNDLWAEVDAFFATDPWMGEGHAGPRQQLAFMVCYNIDAFRAYCNENQLTKQYRIDRERRRRIERDDAELLKFGFDWLLHVLGNQRTVAG
ncbi:MAG: YkgJ family cysteine cluster protein [Candidatus Electrothrix sp. AUS1_2]|nr:YkgJ family cysteine cluster protein [Candidatus Electrothrix sp. AUS1_2]